MRYTFRRGAQLIAAATLAAVLAACGAPAVTPAAVEPAAAEWVAAPAALPEILPAAEAQPARLSLSSSGDVQALREVDLTFLAGGQVAEVLVQEGARVEAGQVIAVLDTRPLDQQVQQAEAALALAQAQLATLSDAPRAADVRAAQAQVQQAEVALAQTRNGQAQDIRAAEAALEAAQLQAQDARDQLSRRKTQAEAAVQSAAQTLTSAQAAYAKALSDWEYVKSTGNNPAQPEIQDAKGNLVDNKVEDTVREAYYAAFIDAQARLRQAELGVAESLADAETARKAEASGVRQAELAMVQAQTALDRLRVAAGQDQVALAQASAELARAQRERLDPDPTEGQLAQAEAGVAQAEAALALAQLNRAYAELRAPFAGVVTGLGIEPGTVVGAGAPAGRLVDDSTLRFEAPVADFDIPRLREGQRVAVSLDALPDAALAGTVSYIAPAAEVRGGARTYLVRVDLPMTEGVRIGMSGQLLLDAGE